MVRLLHLPVHLLPLSVPEHLSKHVHPLQTYRCYCIYTHRSHTTVQSFHYLLCKFRYPDHLCSVLLSKRGCSSDIRKKDVVSPDNIRYQADRSLQLRFPHSVWLPFLFLLHKQKYCCHRKLLLHAATGSFLLK